MDIQSNVVCQENVIVSRETLEALTTCFNVYRIKSFRLKFKHHSSIPIIFYINTASVKFECFLVKLNFLKISRNAPIVLVWKSIFLQFNYRLYICGCCLPYIHVYIMDISLYVVQSDAVLCFSFTKRSGGHFSILAVSSVLVQNSLTVIYLVRGLT